jgi:hypothetical protein
LSGNAFRLSAAMYRQTGSFVYTHHTTKLEPGVQRVRLRAARREKRRRRFPASLPRRVSSFETTRRTRPEMASDSQAKRKHRRWDISAPWASTTWKEIPASSKVENRNQTSQAADLCIGEQVRWVGHPKSLSSWLWPCLRAIWPYHAPNTSFGEISHLAPKCSAWPPGALKQGMSRPLLRAKGSKPSSRTECPFWARKAAAGGDFLGPILGFFGQLQGIFFMRRRRFFWLFGQLQCIFRRLGEVDSAHGKFLAPKETNKNERIKKFYLFSMQLQRKQGLSTRYSTYSAQCKFVYSTRPFQ